MVSGNTDLLNYADNDGICDNSCFYNWINHWVNAKTFNWCFNIRNNIVLYVLGNIPDTSKTRHFKIKVIFTYLVETLLILKSKSIHFRWHIKHLLTVSFTCKLLQCCVGNGEQTPLFRCLPHYQYSLWVSCVSKCVCERVSEWEGDTTQASVSVFQSACVFACVCIFWWLSAASWLLD